MNAIAALEWDRFIGFAQKEAKSEIGSFLVARLYEPTHWAQDIVAARHLQRETQEIASLLAKDALWQTLEGLADPADLLERLEKGDVLSVSDFARLRKWIYAIDTWTQFPRDEIPGELFSKAVNSIMDPFEPLRVLERILTPEGELSERASPRLSALHQEVRSLKKEIASTIDAVVNKLTQRGVLQDAFSDIRDGRYVVPVKASSQSEVEGIIYDASSSGQTVFIEPSEVSPLNNRLKHRQNDLLQEIFNVLSEASGQLRSFASEMKSSIAIIAHWDCVQARARIGLHYSGHPVHVTEDRLFEMPNTAHPLLWFSIPPAQIIRNTIELSSQARTFLITGPNTGGKTVLLKTLGLAGICARTGFPFPGSEPVIVPFFSDFFADLGDPQSLEHHLSSFSGHILRFKEILEQVNRNSLVLIDELNTATDPEEGSALGRAFLEKLMESGAITVTTTHDPTLKSLALSDPRILNASMAFDDSNRTPTFQLVLGIPGRSRALETAERLGIPTPVLELARSYLSQEHSAFEKLLSKLESDTAETTRARKEAVALRQEAEKLRKEWTERTGRAVEEMLDRTRQKLRRILEQAQDEVRATVHKLGETKTRREMDVTRSKLNESFGDSAKKIDSALAEEAPEIAEQLQTSSRFSAEVDKREPAAFLRGQTVKVPKWKNTATILEVQRDKVRLAMGNLQMTLSLREIEPLSESEKSVMDLAKRSQNARIERLHANTVPAPPAQLDLRGIRFDDAMSALEQYLDQAFRSRAHKEVSIVHGLGTGALREGTHQVLQQTPYIKSFRDGGKGSGGTGATLVEFDLD